MTAQSLAVRFLSFSSLILVTTPIFADDAAKAETPTVVAAPAQETPVHSFSENLSLISQYLYRGLTQSNSHPALQGGFDYAHNSGLYAGIWASTITWIRDSHLYPSNPKANEEIDIYGGLKRNLASYPDIAYDLGFLRYEYPGSYDLSAGAVKPNTNELYGALSWKWVTVKYSYSLGSTFGVANARGTNYLDLSAAIPIRDDLTLTLHAGRQKYTGNSGGSDNDSLYTYNDYRVELAKTFGSNWQIGVGATDTNAKDAGYNFAAINKNTGRAAGYVFIKKTF